MVKRSTAGICLFLICLFVVPSNLALAERVSKEGIEKIFREDQGYFSLSKRMA